MQKHNSELHKWYIIHTHSGFEAKVINKIKEEIRKKGLSNYFEDFLVSRYSDDFFVKKL